MIKALDQWLPTYLSRKKFAPVAGTTHLLLAVCDHFEPLHQTDLAGAKQRLAEWQAKWPALADQFHDADGVRPRHTFFFPIEQYDADMVEQVSLTARASGGEVEVHLHHEHDTAEGLREKLDLGVRQLRRHGWLSRDASGTTRFGFIHGDWALDNSHPDGQACGVRNELAVLRAAGCYADFTMPSLPDPTQTRIINSLYYARGTDRPKSHNHGELARSNPRRAEPIRPRAGELLLVQGPSGLNWRRRKLGLFPRLENGDLTGNNPPTLNRLRLWRKLGIHVRGRPEWLFIKLHTHGCHPRNSTMLLGPPMLEFHRQLAELCRQEPRLQIHYVSAREMVNILHAAEDGLTGNPGDFRDYAFKRLAPDRTGEG